MTTRSVLLRPGLYGLALFAAVAACSDDDDNDPAPAPQTPNIVQQAQATSSLSTLVTAVTAADLVDTLTGPGPFTVFAPTNAAFDALPAGALDALLADQAALREVLLYHVIADEVTASEVVTLNSATTVQGADIMINVSGSDVMINGANVIQTDVDASNGVVHIIDAVLMPPEQLMDIVETAMGASQFSTLAGLIGTANLVDTLKGDGPFTVFAPTNAAFEALPAETLMMLQNDTAALAAVLTYHVVAGSVPASDVVNLTSATTVQGEDVMITVDNGTVMINDATVTTTDIMASNGIIHEIDTVLIPPSMALPTIVEIASADENFSTLVTALQTANLVETLNGPGPFTVFAPTNAAFDAIAAADLQALLADIPALTQVLTYHVVAGRVPAADVVNLTSATTVSGIDIRISVDNGNVIINDSVMVTMTDIMASNGIIHVIDAVLLPPTIVDIAVANPDFSTLVTALQAANLVDTLNGAGPFTVFAPTNAAFAAIPAADLQALLADVPALTGVLNYHVIADEVTADEVVTLDTAVTASDYRIRIAVDNGNVILNGNVMVTTTDIRASNGVIHVIDAVLIPQTITDVAAANADFGTLVTALGAADLVDTLNGPGPFTVFAPTNAAFDALPAGVLQSLLGDIPALTNVLTYHVVSGDVQAAEVVNLNMATALNNGTIGISVEGGGVVLTDEQNNSVNVTTTDILTANGVIHVIDAVLLPN